MLLLNNKFLKVSVLIVSSLFVLSACVTNKVKVDKTKTFSIQEWKTSNGARVLYVYAPELPMVDIQAIFDAGSVRDGNKLGLASLTNNLLSHGTKFEGKVLTVDDISEQFEDIGARFGGGSSKDNAKLNVRTLTEERLLNKAVATLQAIINAPTFNKKEIERVRKQLLVGFEGRKQSPGTIASELFYKGLYGKHPYANPSVGTAEYAKKFSQKDLFRFYKKHYVAKNTLVTIVGDVDESKAKLLAEKLVGKLPVGEKTAALIKVKDLVISQFTHKEFPSTQTHITMGHPGIHRKDKDYFTLYVANHILGGSGFGSRIMQEIREKRGLAYSSYSYFSPLLRRGPFTIGMQTSNKKTKEALLVLKQTLNNFIDKGPTEKELLHSKKNITGGFPLRIDSNSDISNYLAVIGFYDLPLNYLNDFNKKIEAVTLEQIKETVKRRIHPNKMFTVTVGTNVN